jgi:hypothetical protein
MKLQSLVQQQQPQIYADGHKSEEWKKIGVDLRRSAADVLALELNHRRIMVIVALPHTPKGFKIMIHQEVTSELLVSDPPAVAWRGSSLISRTCNNVFMY